MSRSIVHQTCLALCGVLIAAAAVSAEVVERLITVIEGEPYTLRSLSVYAKSSLGREFPTGDLNPINTSDREVLEQFITDKLLESEVRELGIKVSDAEVDHYIGQIKEKNRLSDDDLKVALSREGQTLASYRVSVKRELEKNELIDRQVRKKVNITDEDVERYYKLNLKKFRTEERARLRHIMLSLSEAASKEEVRRVMEKAAILYQRIRGGEDFAKLAMEFSEGAGRAEGGEIGWIKRGTLIAGLEEVAFDKLSVGEVSEPFRTSMGVHIVKLEAIEKGTPLPLASVAPRIKQELYAKALEERFVKWSKTDLRKKRHVEVKIPGVVFKAEEADEGVVGSLMARSTGTNKKEERTFLSYLNPFSYISKETEIDENDPASPVYGKKVVSVFGVPLFTSEDVDEDTSDPLSVPVDKPSKEPSNSENSGGFFSGVGDALNPFSSNNP